MSGQEGIDPTAAIGHHPDEQSIFGQSALCGFALRDVPEGVIFRLATIPALVTCSVCSELAWPWLSDLLAAARAEGAEKARAEDADKADEAIQTVWRDFYTGGHSPESPLFDALTEAIRRVRAALAGGERDE